ncbi:CDGSH iron-sulfur domain-containing protein 2 [Thelohanellus kitauei]|uniref:CDGSH iron-sulfur domain-containing protein 2 n=1 Tax=Thelohanellus kitauei TaxID=669202 RepID=A0A0C2NDY7_THEKT|nr:CDGSH iron-sulfur domain-containing protein 2 [Thelohanellus kitauei]
MSSNQISYPLIIGSAAIGFTIGFAAMHLISWLDWCPSACKRKCKRSPCQLNQKIRLNEEKVVDTVKVKDLEDQAVFCRCFQSNNFPYCDGSHNDYNAMTGDNLGPLIIEK